MKNLFFLFLAGALLTLAACGKDDTAVDKIEGEWSATSFVVLGQEQMGTEIESFELEFSGTADNSGTFTGRSVNTDGSMDTDNGTFVISEDEDLLTITYDDDMGGQETEVYSLTTFTSDRIVMNALGIATITLEKK